MTGPPPRDDLSAARETAREADRLSAWLDANLARSTARTRPVPGDAPPLAATACDAQVIADAGFPTADPSTDRAALWEDLMDQFASAQPPVAGMDLPRPLQVPRRPVIAAPKRGHPVAGRLMGLVATLTLATLVGFAGLGVYLSRPTPPAPATSALSILAASPTHASPLPPTPVRADATPIPGREDIWVLPPATSYELPVIALLGSDWHPLVGSNYLFTLDRTNVQAETHTWVNGSGQRVRVIVANVDVEVDAMVAWSWAEREIAAYDDSLYTGVEETPDERRAGRLSEPLPGCDLVTRTEGREITTSFSTWASACVSRASGTMVLVSVSGDPIIQGGRYPLHPADDILLAVIDYVASAPAT